MADMAPDVHAVARPPDPHPGDERSREDGRDTRWAQHRLSRRRELVQAALRAIRHRGPGVGMEEIAAEAGTSKTVVYRHLGDRNGVYLAVVEAVDALILQDLDAAMRDGGRNPEAGDRAAGTGEPGASLTGLVASMVDSYLQLVERDPEIYRFVVTRPLLDRPVEQDPVAGLTSHIGDQMAGIFAEHLSSRGLDTGPAPTWGHGLVGFVRAAADHWLSEPGSLDRSDVVAHVTDLIGTGLQTTLDRPAPPPAARPATPPDSAAPPDPPDPTDPTDRPQEP